MRPFRRSGVPTALLLALALVAGACSKGELGPIDEPSAGDDGLPTGGGPGSDGLPGGGGGASPDGGVRLTVYSGRYELTSIVDLAGANAFGDTISTTLVQLSLFHDHPAATILNLMALYDVPYFAQVWDVLPGFIKDKLTDLLDQLIVDALFDNIPVVDQAAELITEMTLRGPLAGSTQLRGDHVMKGLGFHLWGAHASIPLPDAFGQITQLEVRAGLTPIAGPITGPQARLTLSKQNFAIPYGAMIMDAVKELVFVPAGTTDLGGWLNHIISCRSIASGLGNLCILGECVKDLVSIDSMTGFCSSGLGIVGFAVEASVRSLKIDLADLTNGQCAMYDKGYGDTRGDGKMDAISDGNWDMLIHVGGVAKTVKSPFDGRRIADE
jgi:hypothetical protein